MFSTGFDYFRHGLTIFEHSHFWIGVSVRVGVELALALFCDYSSLEPEFTSYLIKSYQ